MHDEDGFLSAIRQTPADDTARLVFADWLDEQDDPTAKTKADFIRLELRMASAPQKNLSRVRLLNQLQKLASAIDPGWLAVVSHPKLEACRMQFQFECPKQWERLTPTADDKVRFCNSCKKNVHYCDTLQEAQTHAANGNCVAVSLGLIRRTNDLWQPRPWPLYTPGRRMGRFLPPGFVRRLPTAGQLDPAAVTVVGSIPAPPPPPPAPHVPEPEDEKEPRPPRKPKRKKSRRANRNIQRENWQEVE
jgi:uncharacterized protein (TIGR02996 family)